MGEELVEEACAGKPQAGFCEGEAHNGAGSNTVTLSRPKGESNGEYKAVTMPYWAPRDMKMAAKPHHRENEEMVYDGGTGTGRTVVLGLGFRT